ncbi:MAG: ATP-binding cassette domain-containing protein [Bacteroidaceae bacterium]|nr:ATP-binding cassette domain-containing protein [Bacteroidaceae bacterium]
MNTITLKNVLPRVFSGRENELTSEIWLRDVEFQRGKKYLIEAASGTGKSSLLAFLIGYRHDYDGTICFDGRDISTLSTAEWVELRQRSLALLFQELRLFPELTAWENVEVKNSLTGFKDMNSVSRWFEAFGIADKKDVKIGKMSFGQQQRVAMIRALAQPFDFLLADEPISHLDESNSRVMAEIMQEEARAQGAGIIVTSIGKHMEMDYDFRIKM